MASLRVLSLPLLLTLFAFSGSTVHASSRQHHGGGPSKGTHEGIHLKSRILSSTPDQRGRRLHRLLDQSRVRKAVTKSGKLPTWDPLVGHGSPFFQSSQDQEKKSNSSKSQVKKFSSSAPSNDGYRITEEVAKPIQRPRGVTPCTVSILTQEPFYTYEGDAPVSYAPPISCGATWRLVVVSVSAQVTGVQFDRRFAFFLDDVPLVVATTAEPNQDPGVIFKVERDITSYSSFLRTTHNGHVVLQNPVDDTYTGIFYVNVTLQFYPGAPPTDLPNVIIPVGDSATGDATTTFTAPPNAYKATVELYISHYGNDEFYFDDVPRSYYNSLPSYLQPFFASGTAFREIVALLDGSPVGVIFPKVVFYSGALDPRLWSPFMGIGSLNMLRYTLDITPFVGLLLDGKKHSLTFDISYTESSTMWVMTGAVKIWTDPKMFKTFGGVISRQFSGNNLKEEVTNPGDLNTNITTWASRSYQFSGFVVSSLGRITTNVSVSLSFKNIIQQYDNFNSLAIRQETATTSSVITQLNGVVLSSVETSSSFPFKVTQAIALYDDGTYSSSQGVSHKVETSCSLTTPKSSQSTSLNNEQNVQSSYSANYWYGLTSYSSSTSQKLNEKTKVALCSGCPESNTCYGRNVASQWSWSPAAPLLYPNISKNSTASFC